MNKEIFSKIKEDISKFPLIKEKISKIKQKFIAKFIFLTFSTSLFNLFLLWEVAFSDIIQSNILALCLLFLVGIFVFICTTFFALFLLFFNSFPNLMLHKKLKNDIKSKTNLDKELFLTSRKDLISLNSALDEIHDTNIQTYKTIHDIFSVEKKIKYTILQAFFDKESNSMSHDNLMEYIKIIKSESLSLGDFMFNNFHLFLSTLSDDDFNKHKSSILETVSSIEYMGVKKLCLEHLKEKNNKVNKKSEIEENILDLTEELTKEFKSTKKEKINLSVKSI